MRAACTGNRLSSPAPGVDDDATSRPLETRVGVVDPWVGASSIRRDLVRLDRDEPSYRCSERRGVLLRFQDRA